MNTTSRTIISILALLVIVLGVTTVAEMQRARELSAQLEETKTLEPRRGAASVSEDRLREMLNDQEAANAQLRAEIAQLKSATAAPAATQPATEPSVARDDRAAGTPWLERIRREDPERYRQIVEQREQRRKATDEWYQSKIDELDRRSQTAPTQDEAELATQIADTLAKLNDLRAQWAAIRDLPEDQRRAASQQLQADTRETYQALNELRDRDRTMQFGSLLQSIGVTDPRTLQAGVEGITKIYENTRYGPPRGEGGRPPQGGPPPGP
jgi:hypothetical protein